MAAIWPLLHTKVADPITVTDLLAKAIEWMYHHETERRKMGLDAYHFARKQRWEVKIKQHCPDLLQDGSGEENQHIG